MKTNGTFKSDLVAALIKKDAPNFKINSDKFPILSESFNTLTLAVFDWVATGIDPKKAQAQDDMDKITNVALYEATKILAKIVGV